MNPDGLGFPLVPPAASTMAGRLDALVLVWLGVTGGVTLLVAALILWFAFHYRRRPGDRTPPQVVGSPLVETVWVLVPLALFMIPFVWGARLYVDFYRTPPGALEITGVGRQWMWKFYHPGGLEEIDELHLPLGRPVRLILTSEDVIHSFFVPAFRAKQDAVPGRYVTLAFQPSRTGRFHLFCSEYCGTAHSQMRGWVTVMRPDEYERWAALGATRSAASEGAKLFQQYGCFVCHRDDSLRRAPSLAGLYGRPVQLQTGERVVADETYLRESILDPAAKVVLGYQPIMPPFRGRLSEEQVLQLIAYVKSLGRAPAAGGPPADLPPEGQPLFPTPPSP